MKVGVVALAVNASIIGVAHRWIMDAVSGIEMFMAVDRYTWGV
jgi:hypothetical protein